MARSVLLFALADYLGAALCLLGVAVIMYAPRVTS